MVGCLTSLVGWSVGWFGPFQFGRSIGWLDGLVWDVDAEIPVRGGSLVCELVDLLGVWGINAEDPLQFILCHHGRSGWSVRWGLVWDVDARKFSPRWLVSRLDMGLGCRGSPPGWSGGWVGGCAVRALYCVSRMNWIFVVFFGLCMCLRVCCSWFAFSAFFCVLFLFNCGLFSDF